MPGGRSRGRTPGRPSARRRCRRSSPRPARAPRRRRAPVGGSWRAAAPEPRPLGDLPVLAEDAVERAAGGRERVGLRAGRDVEERLLLDGVHGHRDRGAVRGGVEHAVAVLTHAADARRGPVAPGSDARTRRSERIHRAGPSPAATGTPGRGPPRPSTDHRHADRQPRYSLVAPAAIARVRTGPTWADLRHWLAPAACAHARSVERTTSRQP